MIVEAKGQAGSAGAGSAPGAVLNLVGSQILYIYHINCYSSCKSSQLQLSSFSRHF